jgi:hypothetical protein
MRLPNAEQPWSPLLEQSASQDEDMQLTQAAFGKSTCSLFHF